MTDILSTATVTTIIKAHYTAFAFIVVGIVAVLLWKFL